MSKMNEGNLKDAAAILTDSRKLESMTLQLQAELDGFENGMKAIGDLPDKGKGVMNLRTRCRSKIGSSGSGRSGPTSTAWPVS